MKAAVERRMEILDMVNQQGKTRVEDLAELFKVSSVTIAARSKFFLRKMAISFALMAQQF